MLVGSYSGHSPPARMLAAIRAGRIGGVLLLGGNTAGGVGATRAEMNRLQRAARSGGNPGLLIMTDQEGGDVSRFSGAGEAPSQIQDAGEAGQDGLVTGRLLRAAGVNVDLAPVADVIRANGFIAREGRSFGSSPADVAAKACAYAGGLTAAGVGYTLKHFPGLGDALQSTDDEPVAVPEPAAELDADGAAYRRCGRGSRALVMVSSASYPSLTGDVPAVLSPTIYGKVMGADRIDAVTISDALDTPGLRGWSHPALRALSAGVDMVMYAHSSDAALIAYRDLANDLRSGELSAARVRAAAARVVRLKRALGLF